MDPTQLILTLRQEAQDIIDRNKLEEWKMNSPNWKVGAFATWFKTFLDPERVTNIEKVDPHANIATIVGFAAGDALKLLRRYDIPDDHPDKPALTKLVTSFVVRIDCLPAFLASKVAA